MSYSLTQLLLLSSLPERPVPVAYSPTAAGFRRITHHPATYVLSLGYCRRHGQQRRIELAYRHGYSFQLYYLVSCCVPLAILLMPLLRLCRVYQLASVADL